MVFCWNCRAELAERGDVSTQRRCERCGASLDARPTQRAKAPPTSFALVLERLLTRGDARRAVGWHEDDAVVEPATAPTRRGAPPF